jgi:hypothetical protein
LVIPSNGGEVGPLAGGIRGQCFTADQAAVGDDAQVRLYLDRRASIDMARHRLIQNSWAFT